MRRASERWYALPLLSLFVPVIAGCQKVPSSQQPPSGLTTITVGTDNLRTGVKRFGINLSGQSFYDSGQLLRNLTFRNPGFEGETWQSILHCKAVTTSTCTDENQYTVWPEGFLAGATLEVLTGPSAGATRNVITNSVVRPPQGITVRFAVPLPTLQPGDFVRVRMDKPGGADAGWWINASSGARIATEFKDLSPHSPGKQALRAEAASAGQSVKVSSYFDTLEAHSFVHLRGTYQIQFRAKPLAGSRKLHVSLQRLDTAHGMSTFFDRDVPLLEGWHDYSFTFQASEPSTAIGGVALTFAINEAAVLLDDVALTPTAPQPNNPTAFRDEVLQTLRELRPGVLRYMDNGTNFGSSLDNMVATPFARQRAGSSTQQTVQEDIPIGLHEFLVLCQAVGADPWYVLPPGTTAVEADHLIEYLSGARTTPYGMRRDALGQAAPWSTIFPVIHLELGNEQWNARSFAGSAINDPVAYAHRAATVFTAARRSAAYDRTHFDLIVGSWSAVPWWTEQQIASNPGADTIAIAPYLFAEFNDARDAEAVFAPMLAQPEQIDSRPDGVVRQQLNASTPKQLSVYEVNLGTMAGKATQADIDSAVPSMGAGLAVADHMLLMLRDLGVTNQAFFALPEFRNDFAATGGKKETMPLWGAVVDMGGSTNLRRPQFLALQMINEAMLPTMIKTSLSGADPTWDQPLSTNDKIHLPGAHLIQCFAFADGRRRSLIVLNLSRSEALPLAFAGDESPNGTVRKSILTSARITDSNESQENVKIQSEIIQRFDKDRPLSLPPFSMTVLTWTSAQR